MFSFKPRNNRFWNSTKAHLYRIAVIDQIKDMLTDYVKKGNTVVLTTHILEIAERLAERISIILDGRIIAAGTLDELRSRAGAAAGPSGATLEDVFLGLTEPA